jgi:hypothetical protein
MLRSSTSGNSKRSEIELKEFHKPLIDIEQPRTRRDKSHRHRAANENPNGNGKNKRKDPLRDIHEENFID